LSIEKFVYSNIPEPFRAKESEKEKYFRKMFYERKWQEIFLEKINGLKVKNLKVDGKILSFKKFSYFI